VSFTPGGHRGVGQAIAITSQSFDGDANAWKHLGWEAAAGATISGIAVVHPAGARTVSSSNNRSGVAEQVLEIIFCGEFDPEDEKLGDTIDDGKDVGGEGDEGDDETKTEGELPATNEGVETVAVPDDTTTPITDENPAPEATDEDATEIETVVRGAVLQRPDRITPAPRTDQVTVAATDDGTEVLGVALARTGTDLGGLAAAGALGLMAGGLVLLSTRRREAEEVAS
jgi:LPXTG-motif cell wall-anchored protein